MSLGSDRSRPPKGQELRVTNDDRGGSNNASADMAQRLAELIDEREALAAELKAVKRKYRRAATDAQAVKSENILLRTQLADAEAKLAATERKSVVAISRKFIHSLSAGLKPRQSMKAQRAEQSDLVRKSHLFDADWYLATYADVAEARLDPAVHYVTEGGLEGRDPGPEFSSSRYLKANRDVAQSGLNPLVHYLEHGLAEGRSAGGSGSALPRRSAQDFGPAAPVYRSSLTPDRPVRWLRHYELDERRSQVRIGQQVGGYLPTEGAGSVITAVARFLRMSGMAEEGLLADSAGEAGPAMADGWFASHSLFQSRWEIDGARPVVIRAFQRGRDGQVALIGEGLASSSLDVVDFPAAHPYFPILFLAGRPDGECISATNLFFPSLCRGGQHYAEFLLDGAHHGFSPVGLGDHRARTLEAILVGAASALLGTVRVDLAGADGTRPMFQRDCKDWLALVMRMNVGDAIEPVCNDSAAYPFLRDRAAASEVDHGARGAALAQLIVPSDSVPTIAALAATASGDASGEPATHATSMIVVTPDPAQPALSVDIPTRCSFPSGDAAPAFPLAFPRIVGTAAPQEHLRAAIRMLAERGLGESELLQPLAQPLAVLPPPEAARPAVVAIEPAHWSLAALEAGLAALALQQGSDLLTVCMIGAVDPQRRAMVELSFAGRTTSRVNVHAFVDGLDETDVLHLGSGIILHDSRTLQTFQSILSGASSASCPILSCTKQGKNWAVGVTDAGEVPARSGQSTVLARHADMLWRSAFPIWKPPSDLWFARPGLLRNAPEEPADPHACCTWITASYWDSESRELPTLSLPAARPDWSISLQELVG